MPPIPSIPSALIGNKEGTFAFITIRDRWPKIIAKIIDCVHRYRHIHAAAHGEEGIKDIKFALSELSELRYRISTDKPLQDLVDNGESVQIWNKELEELRTKKGAEQVTWFRCDWLFSECYLYRRLAGIFLRTNTLVGFDPFSSQKQNGFIDGINAIAIIAKYLEKIPAEPAVASSIISHFLQVSLWGNVFDMSLSCGEGVTSLSLLNMVDKQTDKILCNQIDEAERILRSGKASRVDIVLDNSGLELFADLALADLLINRCGVNKVYFHGKSMSWFVSDVTSSDFNWIIEMLIANSEESLRNFGMTCSRRLSDGSFIFQAHPFWTLPFSYNLMDKKAPDLHHDLSQSALIIFKGDLNYRKLVSDLDWPLDTPFKIALRGFTPAPLLALRTLKAETQVGLSPKVIDLIREKYGTSKSWMVTGEYAVAQFAC